MTVQRADQHTQVNRRLPERGIHFDLSWLKKLVEGSCVCMSACSEK